MKKVMAVFEEPQNCTECYFHVCKWLHSCWSVEKPNTQGVYCQLDPNRQIYELEFGETGYKLGCCPLKPARMMNNQKETWRWIPLSEQQPDPDKRVLVYRKYMEESDVGPISVQFGWSCKDATHWMPLPCKPE